MTSKLIHDLESQIGGSLNSSETSRINSYTFQSALTSSWFSTLRGTPISDTERKIALYTGAISPLLDDMTDELGVSSFDIWNGMNVMDNQSYSLKRIEYLNHQLLQITSSDYQAAFKAILAAQDHSIKQILPHTLGQDELIGITKEKGAKATVFFRMILTNDLIQYEQSALETLGYLLQLINDAFDVYKDFKNQQQTLVTTSEDISAVYDLFLEIQSKFIKQWSQLSYSNRNQQNALREISIILGRGHVCFHQLIDLQKKHNGIFEVSAYNRSQLICDMEKPKNLWVSVKFSQSIMNEFSQI